MKLKGEDAEQQALFQYAALQQDPSWQMMFAIPNGGRRWINTALKMKATGLKAGIPDIFLPVARTPWNGLFIEMKSLKGSVAPNQKVWHQLLREQDYRVAVCKGCDAAIEVITEYLNTRFTTDPFRFAIACEDIEKGMSGRARLI